MYIATDPERNIKNDSQFEQIMTIYHLLIGTKSLLGV